MNDHEKLRRLVMQHWDPIGVSKFAEAQDEYDTYIRKIYSLLTSNCSLKELESYLTTAETQHMGLSGDSNRTRRFAELLLQMREANELF